MKESFKLEEIQELCHILGLDYEELAGEVKSARIRSLITACRAQGRLPALIGLCRERRPAVSWPDPDQPYALAELLGEMPAQRLPYEPETILVPAGPFLMGSPAGPGVDPAETPQHQVTLPGYHIGLYPVTNAQYGEFIRQSGYDQAALARAGWFLGRPPTEKLDHPVVAVSWPDALAYCRWRAVHRGGSFNDAAGGVWCSQRRHARAGSRTVDRGFRVVIEL